MPLLPKPSIRIITTLPKGGLLHGYKPCTTGQRLKALASLVFSPMAFATLAAPQGATVLLATLKRVLILFYA